MDGAGPLPQQTIARHGKEDSGLPEQHDKHGGAESAHCPEFDQQSAPAMSGDVDPGSNRGTNVEHLVADQAGQNQGNDDVEDRADHERTDDADWHISTGVFRLLRGCRNCVETDVSEEDRSGAGHDSVDAVAAIGLCRRDKRMPMGMRDLGMLNEKNRAHHDEYRDDGKFDEYDRRV